MVPDVELQRLDVDGIATFFVAAEGPTMAGLVFRVGQADETLATRGITHLVEHLALTTVGQSHSEMNGMVAATETSFVVRGSTEEVGSFLKGVTTSLTTLPLGRFEAERRILAVEASHKRPSVDASLLVHRFGAQGYGLPAMPELGVKRVTASEIEQWSRRWMTTANAALWIVGQIPDALTLDLPTGTRMVAPDPVPLPERLPAWYPDQGAIVALDALRPRSDALQLAVAIARARVQDRLRQQDASSYAVIGHAAQWTKDGARVFLAADTLAEQAATTVSRFLAAIGELAIEGPTPEELARSVRDAASAWSGPHVGGQFAYVRATHHLHDRPARPLSSFLADLEAVTVEQVAAETEAMRSAALIAVPAKTSVNDRRYLALPAWSPSRVQGRELSRTTWLDDQGAENRLLVAPQGITYVASGERAVTVAFRHAVAVQRWEDGARTIFGSDGFRIFVHPEEWVDGSLAVETIDHCVDPEMVVATGIRAGSRLLEEARRRAQPTGTATPAPPPPAPTPIRRAEPAPQPTPQPTPIRPLEPEETALSRALRSRGVDVSPFRRQT